MRNLKRTALSLVLALALVVAFTAPAFAQNPTVTITVSARLIAITNTQNTWDIGVVVAGGSAVYFSADGNADVDYSQIENTGNVAVDVEFQGTDFEGGAYDWTLGASAGDQIVKIAANTVAAPTVYDVLLKTSEFNDLVTGLAKDGTYDWSMEFTPPTAFHASENGAEKEATVTLVASAA
jgi:hypothetical protein